MKLYQGFIKTITVGIMELAYMVSIVFLFLGIKLLAFKLAFLMRFQKCKDCQNSAGDS